MGRRKSSVASDLDRFIVQRGGTFHYKRRVPAAVAELDDRAPHVRASLKTGDIAVARLKRDALEAADDALWAGLLSGDPVELARKRYEAAASRAEALGFIYRPSHELTRVEDVVTRLEAVADERTPVETSLAVLGAYDRPRVSVTAAFQIFLDEIVPSALAGKSEEQKRQWRKVVRRAINNFVEINGDMPIDEVARDHALKVYNWWSTRIVPKSGRATHTPSSGNRDLGNLRGFYRAYFTHLGMRDRPNPFADLSFSEKRRARRPPFPTDWIRDRILAPGALATMNKEARGIILAMVETGMRPSEIANITPECIVLDHPVPHVIVQARSDPDDPRETKTAASERKIPLVGVSLAAFRAHPQGFPRYRNRESSLSATINKRLREHGLLPTDKHVLYSLRHSFEDRMKDAEIDAELRAIMMGHAIERPLYGEGGSLAVRHKALKKMALPFDRKIVRMQVEPEKGRNGARRRASAAAETAPRSARPRQTA